MTDLRRYWPSLLAEHTEILDRLVAAYDGPHRAYHDTLHLAEVFERIDVLLASEPDAGVDRDALRLAAWFHDAVYDTEGDNEERSAALAESELSATAAPRGLIDEVSRLVRLTATHRPTDDDSAGKVLCDADLGILAESDARYREYVRGVRREYADLPEDGFRTGRADILRKLLDAPSVFHTSFAKQHWEQRARRSVAQELTELAAPSGNR